MGIQDWRPSTPRCHPRHNCKDPAANAAFSWEADTIGKVAGTVIVAANHHQRMDAAGPFARDHAHAGFSAIVRQIEARSRQLATTHGDGALMKIGPASHLRPVCEITVCPHVVGKRQVAKARLRLGTGHHRINRDGLIVGEEAHELQGLSDCLAGMMPSEDNVGHYAMAPVLMKGLRGMPFSYSSCTMELKGEPDGSRPRANTFEML